MINRNYAIDWLKVISITFVVLIHSTSFIYHNNFATFYNYYFYRYFLDLGVPIFFTISGYYLGRKLNQTYINKQIIKILKIYLLTTFVYILLNIISIITNYLLFSVDIKPALLGLLQRINILNLINGSIANNHLWYLTSLIICYLIYKVFIYLKMKMVLIIIVVFSLFLVQFQSIVNLTLISKNGSFFSGIVAFTGGFLISKYMIKNSKGYIIGIISVLIYVIFKFEYSSGFSYLLLAFSASMLVSNASLYISKNNLPRWKMKIFDFVVPIYLMHYWIISFIMLILNGYALVNQRNIFLIILITVCSCVILSNPLYKYSVGLFINRRTK